MGYSNIPKSTEAMITHTYTPEIKLPDRVIEDHSKFSSIGNSEKSHLLNYLHDLKRTNNNKFNSRVMMYRAISLCISLSLVIMIFEWKSYGDENLLALSDVSAEFEEILDVPVTEQPPPPPQQTQVVNITEVPDVVEIENEIEIDLDVEVTEESKIEEVIYEELAFEEEEAEEIFQFVEEAPTPKTGISGFYEYVAANLKYPMAARKSMTQGKVYVQFVIGKDGSISDVQVLKGIGFGCDEEAIKVLESAPNWNPGKQRGQPVKVRMSLPITFKLLGT